MDGLDSGKLPSGLACMHIASCCVQSSRVRAASHHLFSNLDDSLQRESAATVVEEVFQRRAEQIDYEDVVKTLLPEVVHVGNAGCRASVLIREPSGRTRGQTNGNQQGSCRSCTHLAIEEHRSCEVPRVRRLANQLSREEATRCCLSAVWVEGVRTYEFDGDLLVVQEVGSLEDDTE